MWNGEITQTRGGLRKSDLMRNKDGKIVSKRKHAIGMKLHRAYGKKNAAVLKKNQYKKRRASTRRRRSRTRSRTGKRSRRR